MIGGFVIFLYLSMSLIFLLEIVLFSQMLENLSDVPLGRAGHAKIRLERLQKDLAKGNFDEVPEEGIRITHGWNPEDLHGLTNSYFETHEFIFGEKALERIITGVERQIASDTEDVAKYASWKYKILNLVNIAIVIFTFVKVVGLITRSQ